MQIKWFSSFRLIFVVAIVSTLILAFYSCKKDDVKTNPEPSIPPTPTELGNLNIEFVNMVDNAIFGLGEKYLSPSGDTFTVNKFNYYISNIVLVKEDNSVFTQTNSYHLIEASNPSSCKISIGSVPFGKYKSIRFLLGVDSARNVSGAQTGALDPAKGMFWNWSTGYIMLKLEGAAPTSTVFGNIEYHTGGFKGVNKVQRDFDIGFNPSILEIAKNQIPRLSLKTNINEIFQTPNDIRFSTLPVVTSAGANAKKLADNYQDMISFKSIE